MLRLWLWLILLDTRIDPRLLWMDLEVVGYSNSISSPEMLLHSRLSMWKPT